MTKTKSQHQISKSAKEAKLKPDNQSKHHAHKIRSQTIILGIVGGIFLVAIGIAIIFMIISTTNT